jgi:hypothetical protein
MGAGALGRSNLCSQSPTRRYVTRSERIRGRRHRSVAIRGMKIHGAGARDVHRALSAGRRPDPQTDARGRRSHRNVNQHAALAPHHAPGGSALHGAPDRSPGCAGED